MFEQDPNKLQNGENRYDSMYQENSSQSYTDDDVINYYSQPAQTEKKSGGKAFLRVIAGLAAIAIVSVSSIEIYKIFGNNHKKNWSDVPSDPETSSVSDTLEAAEASTEQEAAALPTGAAASWINSAAPSDAMSIPDIVEKNLPSVVGVSAMFEYEDNSFSNYNFWGFNFGYNDPTPQKKQTPGYGTGIIMSEDGYILTNAHCIYDSDSELNAGKAVSVSVVMDNTTDAEYDATIVGYDLETDLAVLKIDATGLTPAEFGDSDQLRVGELVVAIGNPLGFDLFGTTTCGIVSALNREVTINEKKMTLIQTDTAINQGNSGGPLLNSYGQVIGINSAKFSAGSGSSASIEGICFAIPITSAKEIISSLIENGYVAGRPQIGIVGTDVDASTAQRYNMPQGVYVYSVSEGGAAEAAGIMQGDVITGIQGQEITSMEELTDIKNQYNAGDIITLSVYRAGQSLQIQMQLSEVQQSGE